MGDGNAISACCGRLEKLFSSRARATGNATVCSLNPEILTDCRCPSVRLRHLYFFRYS